MVVSATSTAETGSAADDAAPGTADDDASEQQRVQRVLQLYQVGYHTFGLIPLPFKS